MIKFANLEPYSGGVLLSLKYLSMHLLVNCVDFGCNGFIFVIVCGTLLGLLVDVIVVVACCPKLLHAADQLLRLMQAISRLQHVAQRLDGLFH